MRKYRIHHHNELDASVENLAHGRSRRRLPGWVLVGLLSLICWGLTARCGARAEPPLPVISDVPGATTVLGPSTNALVPWSAPPPGPMCSANPFEFIVPIPPTALGLLLLEPPTEAESRFIVRAIDGCGNTNRKIADPFLALALLRLEADMQIPAEAKGIALAWHCREASMRTAAAKGGPIRGDHGLAAGAFQLHDRFRWHCGLSETDADNPLLAAGCMLSRLLLHVADSSHECPHDRWRVGEARTANPGYADFGCGPGATTKHWTTMVMWH